MIKLMEEEDQSYANKIPIERDEEQEEKKPVARMNPFYLLDRAEKLFPADEKLLEAFRREGIRARNQRFRRLIHDLKYTILAEILGIDEKLSDEELIDIAREALTGQKS